MWHRLPAGATQEVRSRLNESFCHGPASRYLHRRRVHAAEVDLIALYGPAGGVMAGLQTTTTERVSRVMIRGTTWDFAGLTELDESKGPTEVRKIWPDAGGLGVSTPPRVTILQMLDPAIGDAVESTWIEIPCAQFSSTGTFVVGGAAGNYYIYDTANPSNMITARVGASDNPLVGTAIPTGFRNLRGIGGQYDATNPHIGGTGFQVQLRYPSELNLVDTVVCCTCGGDFNGSGQVTGDDLGAPYLADFINALLGVGPTNPCMDLNGDANYDGADIPLFVARVIALWTCPFP